MHEVRPAPLSRRRPDFMHLKREEGEGKKREREKKGRKKASQMHEVRKRGICEKRKEKE